MPEPTLITLADLQRVFKALHFAAEKHRNQRRKGAAGEPYINHLIEVTELVARSLSEPDTNLVIAALLHDTIEDTATTKEELITHFGSDVCNLVVELTDDKTLPKVERKRLQIETASRKSARAQSINLADKISNLRSILYSPPVHWDYQRKKNYFAWARQVVDGFATPNAILKVEFEATLLKFDGVIGPGPTVGD